MESRHIPSLMERIDNIVSEDRRRIYSNRVIVKILVVLQLFDISYRSARNFFHNHDELYDLVGTAVIPDFRTLSYRALRMDWHEINACIIDLMETGEENAAIDTFIVQTFHCAETEEKWKVQGF